MGLWKYEAQLFGICFVCFALINDSAFLERKQPWEEMQSEMIYSKPLIWPWLWSKHDSLISLQVREWEGGGNKCLHLKTETSKKRWDSPKCQDSGECLAIVERNQDCWLQIILWYPAHTTKSCFPNPSQLQCINLDLTHSDFVVITCHHPSPYPNIPRYFWTQSQFCLYSFVFQFQSWTP